MINNKTKVFLSVSARPGNFGATVFNALFAKHGVDAVYLPREVKSADDAKSVVQALRALSVSGCGVSSPLKSAVVGLLEALDPLAEKTASVNTIVNRGGHLYGFNTDVAGVLGCLAGKSFKSVLVYGAGSVTGSVLTALKELKVSEALICARKPKAADSLAKKFSVQSVSAADARSRKFDLVINATPASNESTDHELFGFCAKAGAVFDLLVSPQDTKWIAHAKSQNLETISGISMAKIQLQKQFELYTGIVPDFTEINRIVDSSYR